MTAPEKLPSLRDVIAVHGLQPKKSLGQHFLLDTNLLARIARAAGDLSALHVIEIGPGPGGLTRAILEANPATLTAIEKDTRCIAALQSLLQNYPQQFYLQARDALGLCLRDLTPAPRAIIANLPYNVGTAMLVEWLQQIAQHGSGVLQHFTVLLQKEVAQRCCAHVGDPDYGRLAILMQQWTEPSVLFDIAPGSFSPPPKVVSALLHARVLARPREDVPPMLLEKVVAAAFNQRRKMLRQSLKALGGDALALCQAASIDPTWRAEQCDLAAFARLAKAYGVWLQS